MAQHILDAPFWKVVARFSISFLVLLTIVLSTATYFKDGNFNALSASLQDGSWLKFVLIRIVISLIYGIAMAYFSRKKAKQQIKK
jgi:uncharacterized protein (UPF0333 family)